MWGCTSHANSGTHVEFVNIDVDEITIKPSNLNHLEAASLRYAALTTWSALIRWAGLQPSDLKGKKYLYKAVQVALDVFQYNYSKTLVVRLQQHVVKEISIL